MKSTPRATAKKAPAKLKVTPQAKRSATVAAPPARQTKKASVIALLQRPEGVTLTEIMNETGWQEKSVRGFLSGALKRGLGLTIQRVTRKNDETAYQIGA